MKMKMKFNDQWRSRRFRVVEDVGWDENEEENGGSKSKFAFGLMRYEFYF